MRRLPRQTDANVLVGFETSDDAGVYQLTPDLALVQTVDFFTPIVDDPYTFGQIAAANSLSDVYAMGGKPISALSVAAFPPKADEDTLERILRGGLDKMIEAGCSVVGGHSIRDDDLKFGYAVTGTINPRRVWRNVGAQLGDVLLLTKPLGTGVIATALKQGKADAAWVEAATASMLRLNRDAAEALIELESAAWPRGAGSSRRRSDDRISVALVSESPDEARELGPVHAVTDITGFGLLGHAREMALGFVSPASSRPSSTEGAEAAAISGRITLEMDHRAIDYLPGAIECARAGFLAGGLKNNREFIEGCVEFSSRVPEEFRALLFDQQTSGGLLIAIAAEHAEPALAALRQRNVPAHRIGRVVPRRNALLTVV